MVLHPFGMGMERRARLAVGVARVGEVGSPVGDSAVDGDVGRAALGSTAIGRSQWPEEPPGLVTPR